MILFQTRLKSLLTLHGHLDCQPASRDVLLDATGTAAVHRRRVRALSLAAKPVAFCWAGSLLTLVILTCWIFCDGQFGDVARLFKSELLWAIGAGPTIGYDATLASRRLYLFILSTIAVVSFGGIFLGLIVGREKFRSTRAWLLATATIAAWLTLLVSWPELSWHGQAYRLRSKLPTFQGHVQLLAANWPTGDGELPLIGPFLAYPPSNPQVLMPLLPFPVNGHELGFSTVEKAPSGALRFQLADNEGGSWLEWHPRHDTPRSFVGGLAQQFSLDRFVSLNENWYLVRYNK